MVDSLWAHRLHAVIASPTTIVTADGLRLPACMCTPGCMLCACLTAFECVTVCCGFQAGMSLRRTRSVAVVLFSSMRDECAVSYLEADLHSSGLGFTSTQVHTGLKFTGLACSEHLVLPQTCTSCVARLPCFVTCFVLYSLCSLPQPAVLPPPACCDLLLPSATLVGGLFGWACFGPMLVRQPDFPLG